MDFDDDFDVEFEVDSDDSLGWPEKYKVLGDAYQWMSTDSEFTSTVAGLTADELACCVLEATREGHEKLVRAIIELRGPVPIVYQKGRGEHDMATVNGIEFNHNRFGKLKFIDQQTELKSFYKMIRELGMKGIIEPGETFPLLCEKHLGFFNDKPSITFDGELPFLDAGVLKQPELAIALLDESQISVMPAAYQPVLCWATKAMLKEFPGQLAPLTTFQDVDQYGPLAELKNAKSYRQMDFHRIVTGVRPSEHSTRIAGAVFGYMGPESAKFGFDDEQGRVLCETTVNFLLKFETGPSDDARVVQAKTFVDGYFPMDIISAQVTQECVERFSHEVALPELSSWMQKDHTTGFDYLFGLLAKDHSLRDRAMSMMPREMWHKLALKDDGKHLSPESLVTLYETFGIDNTGMTLNLYTRRIMDFFGTGFRFSDQTEVYEDSGDDEDHFNACDTYDAYGGEEDHEQEDDPEEEETPLSPTIVNLQFESTDFVSKLSEGNDDVRRQMLEGYQAMIKLNLWPVQGLKPRDLEHALSMSDREGLGGTANKLVMSLKAYLMLAGVEACVQAATSPRHWTALMETFTNDEMAPYLSIMPKSAKGKMLENVLGL